MEGVRFAAAYVEFSANYAEMEKNLKKAEKIAEKSYGNMQKEIEKVEKAVSSLNKSLGSLNKAFASISSAAGKSGGIISSVFSGLLGVVGNLIKLILTGLGGAFKTLGKTAVKALSLIIKALRTVMATTIRAIKSVAALPATLVKGTVNAIGKISGALEEATKYFVFLQLDIRYILEQFQRIALATSGAIGGAVAAFARYEESFVQVRKVTNMLDSETNKLSDSIQNMSTEIVTSARELADLAAVGGRLGVEGVKNLESFTAVMAKLSITTDIVGEEAASSFARLVSVLEISEDEMENVASTMVDLGNNFAATEMEILEFSRELMGTAKVFGLTVQEIQAMSTALAATGARPQRGATAISRMMTEMSKSVEDQTEQLEVFADVSGKSVERFASDIEDKPMSAIQGFVIGLGELISEGQDVYGILDDVNLSSARMSRVVLNLASNTSILEDAIITANDEFEKNEALTKEVATRHETLWSQVIMLKDQILKLGTSFGELFKPSFMDKLTTVRVFFRSLTEMDKDQMQAIAAFLSLTTAITGTITAVLMAIKAFATFMTGMMLFGRFAVILAPTIGALWLLMEGLKGLGESFDEFELAPARDFVKAFENMGEAIRSLVGDIEGVDVKGAFGELVQNLQDEWENFSESVNELVEEEDLPPGIFTMKFGTEIFGSLGRATDAVSDFVADIEDQVKESEGTMGESFRTLMEEGLDSADLTDQERLYIESAVDLAQSFGGMFLSVLKLAFVRIPSLMLTVFRKEIKGPAGEMAIEFWKNFKESAFPEASGAMSEWAKAINSFADEFSWDSNTSAKEWMEQFEMDPLTRDLLVSFAELFESILHLGWETLKELGSFAWDTVGKDIGEGIKDGIMSILPDWMLFVLERPRLRDTLLGAASGAKLGLPGMVVGGAGGLALGEAERRGVDYESEWEKIKDPLGIGVEKPSYTSSPGMAQERRLELEQEKQGEPMVLPKLWESIELLDDKVRGWIKGLPSPEAKSKDVDFPSKEEINEIYAQHDIKDAFVKAYGEPIKTFLEGTGINYRAVTAQMALETGWGTQKPSDYNLGGIKGKGTRSMTSEYRDGEKQLEEAEFEAYNSFEEFLEHYIGIISSTRYLADEAKTVEEYVERLVKGGYATDPKYGEKLIDTEKSLPKFQEGVILPGAGGGDRIPALLEAGEAVVPYDVVRGGIDEIAAWFRSKGVDRHQTGTIGAFTDTLPGMDEDAFLEMSETFDRYTDMFAKFAENATAWMTSGLKTIIDLLAEVAKGVTSDERDKAIDNLAQKAKDAIDKFSEFVLPGLEEPAPEMELPGLGKEDFERLDEPAELERPDFLWIGKLETDWERMISWFEGIPDYMRKQWDTFVDHYIGELDDTIGQATAWLKKPWEERLDDMKQVFARAVLEFRDAVGMIPDILRGVFANLGQSLIAESPVLSQITQGLRNLLPQEEREGTSAIGGAVKGLTSGNPIDAAVAVFTPILEQSKPFADLLETLADGFAELGDILGVVIEPFNEIAESILDAIKPALKIIAEIISKSLAPVLKALVPVIEFVGNIIMGVAKAIAAVWNAIIGAIDMIPFVNMSGWYIDLEFDESKIEEISDSLRDSISGAFSAADITEFEQKVRSSIYSKVRDALVQAFLETSAMKSLFDQLASQVNNLIEKGMTEARMEKVREAIDAIIDESDDFYKLMKEFGLLADTTSDLNSEMGNVPDVFKVTLERFRAADPRGREEEDSGKSREESESKFDSWLSKFIRPFEGFKKVFESMFDFPSAQTGAEVIGSGAVNVHAGEIITPAEKTGNTYYIEIGNVYGMDDFKNKIREIVDDIDTDSQVTFRGISDVGGDR